MLERLLIIVLAAGFAAPIAAQPAPDAPRNVILMIPDGFGPASITFARLATGERLALDEFLTGSVGTSSADGPITDSAASATAYASGVKTYNGAIGMDVDRQPVGTLLQGARDRGMLTGLVTTTRLTHATPAAFAAHVENRSMETEIAAQMLDNRPDLMMGGGRIAFASQPDGWRDDGRDLVAEARDAGYHVTTNWDATVRAQNLPLIAFLADDHMAYEIDRHRTRQPNLAEVVEKALVMLAPAENGFFLVVEGGRIDHAGHANDPAAHLRDIIAYDEAVRLALDFARTDGTTLVVSAADHETGGLTIGRDGQYYFRPELLLGMTASAEAISDELYRRIQEEGITLTAEMLIDFLGEVSTIDSVDERDARRLGAAVQTEDTWELAKLMVGIVSRQAGLGWTTTGHTAVDVTLHAYGPGAERLRGHMGNDEVGRTLAQLMGIDLAEVTARIRAELAVPSR